MRQGSGSVDFGGVGEMMLLEIEGERIRSEDDFHLLMKERLDFPDYYGMNLDAFWDMMYPLPANNLKIIWKNTSISKRKIGDSFNTILEIFNRLKKIEPNFDYQLID